MAPTTAMADSRVAPNGERKEDHPGGNAHEYLSHVPLYTYRIKGWQFFRGAAFFALFSEFFAKKGGGHYRRLTVTRAHTTIYFLDCPAAKEKVLTTPREPGAITQVVPAPQV